MFASDEEYYADREYLTNSSLKLLHKSPSLFYMWLKRKDANPSSLALDMGKAFHALSLEDKEVFVGYEGTRRGKSIPRSAQKTLRRLFSRRKMQILFTG